MQDTNELMFQVIGKTFPNGFRVEWTHLTQDDTAVFILAKREGDDSRPTEWVTSFVNLVTLRHNEWAWGHYFRNEGDAQTDFYARVRADWDLRCYYCGKSVSGDFETLRGDPVCEDGICVPEEGIKYPEGE